MTDQAKHLVARAWTVPVGHEPIRLDAFARRCLPHLSRREIEITIRDGLFSAGGRVKKKGDRLSAGDELVFQGPDIWLAERPRADENLKVDIVYEDHSLLIVNKPAGMATHGFSARHGATLANFLIAHRPELASVGKSRWEPGLVHRLDRETSGLVVVAKTEAAFQDLGSQFRRRQVKKIYWALVRGIAPPQGTIDLPLSHDGHDSRRMLPLTRPSSTKKQSWNAVTHYRRIGKSRNLSLLEVDMETGVTHQIRVHLATTGHPIVGDQLYGDNDLENFGLRRHFLHARSLTLARPDDGGSLTLDAELPAELAALLKRLKIEI